MKAVPLKAKSIEELAEQINRLVLANEGHLVKEVMYSPPSTYDNWYTCLLLIY